MVPDGSVSLKQGAIAPWAKSSSPYYAQTLEAIARHYGFDMTDPWDEIRSRPSKAILHGTGEDRDRVRLQ